MCDLFGLACLTWVREAEAFQARLVSIAIHRCLCRPESFSYACDLARLTLALATFHSAPHFRAAKLSQNLKELTLCQRVSAQSYTRITCSRFWLLSSTRALSIAQPQHHDSPHATTQGLDSKAPSFTAKLEHPRQHGTTARLQFAV